MPGRNAVFFSKKDFSNNTYLEKQPAVKKGYSGTLLTTNGKSRYCHPDLTRKISHGVKETEIASFLKENVAEKIRCVGWGGGSTPLPPLFLSALSRCP